MRGIALIVIVLALAFGCSKGSTAIRINGKITSGGEPATGAMVRLHPTGDVKLTMIPEGQVQADGTFAVSTFEPGDGVPPGTYKVCITWKDQVRSFGEMRDVGSDKFGGVYATPEKTTLSVTITATSADVVFDLPAVKNQQKPKK